MRIKNNVPVVNNKTQVFLIGTGVFSHVFPEKHFALGSENSLYNTCISLSRSFQGLTHLYSLR